MLVYARDFLPCILNSGGRAKESIVRAVAVGGNVTGGDSDVWSNMIMQQRPQTARQSAERPQKLWVDGDKKVTGSQWLKKAQDRAQWKVLEDPSSSNG